MVRCTLADVEACAPPGSMALTGYLTGVYGPAMSVAEANERHAHWKWADADVIWLRHLPDSLVKRCDWPTTIEGPDSVFVVGDGGRAHGTVWRYTHQAVCRCCGFPTSASKRVDCKPEFGGPRTAVHVEPHGFWIEVAHTFERSQSKPFERDALWMYRAQGSGLSYHTGRTAIASDTVDLARNLSLKLADGYAAAYDRSAPRRHPAIRKGALLHRMRRSGFETVILTHHVDADHWQTSRGFHKIEVIGLRPHRRFVCPPDAASFAWGWRARERPCTCVPTGSNDPFYLSSKLVVFPYRHVECNTTSTLHDPARHGTLHGPRTRRKFRHSGVTFSVVEGTRNQAWLELRSGGLQRQDPTHAASPARIATPVAAPGAPGQ
jgi:hypothetical protein